MDIKRLNEEAADLEELSDDELLQQIEQDTELTATALIDLGNMKHGVGLTESLKRKVRVYCDRHGVNYGAALAYFSPTSQWT